VAAHFEGFVSSIDVISIRMGALITAKTSLDDYPINGLYYWDPVESGEGWLAEMDDLHNALLRDTFRFLRRRKKTKGPVSEFASLQINSELKGALKGERFIDLTKSATTTAPVHILTSADQTASNFNVKGADLHAIDERNDWINHRATTTDMVIHKTANRIADLLEQQIIINDSVAQS